MGDESLFTRDFWQHDKDDRASKARNCEQQQLFAFDGEKSRKTDAFDGEKSRKKDTIQNQRQSLDLGSLRDNIS